MPLPWFQNRFPLFLAPMAGVTDSIFRRLCKGEGADVVVTEFVSAEGIFRKNARTLEYLDFSAEERPLGVQLFGADPDHLAEAARMVAEWKRPDFVDLNFGCPVNKVVCKNGGSALLRDRPLLGAVARAVARAVDPLPVTAKMRIGWDRASINAVATARTLEDAGVATIAVHGRTKDQGYSGEADWDVIGAVARAVAVPVIGNGDLFAAEQIAARRAAYPIAGAMIGRGAMSAPWIFRRAKALMETGAAPPEPPLDARWAFIRRHCSLVVSAVGDERHAMSKMRSRLMAYSRGLPGARHLREDFARISSLAQLDAIAATHLAAASETCCT